jgi:uracil-DNA glycosylase
VRLADFEGERFFDPSVRQLMALTSVGGIDDGEDRGPVDFRSRLTVRLGEPGSHRGIGWEAITAAAITALVDRLDQPLVAILWGRDAQSLEPDLPDVPVIASAHPSPMSADRGFFGSRPFSRANELGVALGADPVDWSLA